jgi:hypothetical protein
MLLVNTDIGKGGFGIIDSKIKVVDVNLKETDKTLAIFQKGLKNYKEKFKKSIIEDLGYIGYDIQDLDIAKPISLTIDASIPIEAVCINVKEADRQGLTDQNSMSTGMFRALALLIYFNYYQFAKIKGTVLVDDIGEGLDFERSTKLIDLITQKAKNQKFNF